METIRQSAAADPVMWLLRAAWRRPEWPWILLAVTAWLALLVDQIGLPTASMGSTHTMHHAMGMHMEGAGIEHHGHHDLSSSSLGWWTVMCAAMMLPATFALLRDISAQGLWNRRQRGPAVFLGAYLVVWTAFGAAMLGLASLAHLSRLDARLAIGLALLAGAAWGLTRTKRRFLQRCHRCLPLPQRGVAADLACVRFGLYHGAQCAGVCWPVMLAMVPAHSLSVMVAATAFVTWERIARLPRLRRDALVVAAAGTLSVLVAAA